MTRFKPRRRDFLNTIFVAWIWTALLVSPLIAPMAMAMSMAMAMACQILIPTSSSLFSSVRSLQQHSDRRRRRRRRMVDRGKNGLLRDLVLFTFLCYGRFIGWWCLRLWFFRERAAVPRKIHQLLFHHWCVHRWETDWKVMVLQARVTILMLPIVKWVCLIPRHSDECLWYWCSFNQKMSMC